MSVLPCRMAASSLLDSRWVRVFCDASLAWWELRGRRDPFQKPWMFKADGQWPAPDEGLHPYPIHVAEVMLHFATQEA